MDALLIEGLRKRYGNTTAVHGLDLAVPEGQIFGILGPNGSGKTTTVECAYGLRAADAGTIRVFGLDPRAQPERVARLVGTQLQDSALPDRITVREAVHLFAALAGTRVDEARVLDKWGLSGKGRASFASLSGGQRQRLFVALALLGRPRERTAGAGQWLRRAPATPPRMVFLDEMTTGLDPAARREVWQLVEEIRDEGTTVVLVTHFMDEAQRLCDRVAVLVDGRIRVQDTPAGLVARYGGGMRVRFVAWPGLEPAKLRALPDVSTVESRGDQIEMCGGGRLLAALGHLLTVEGHGETDLLVCQNSLEDAYLSIVDGQEAACAG